MISIPGTIQSMCGCPVGVYCNHVSLCRVGSTIIAYCKPAKGDVGCDSLTVSCTGSVEGPGLMDWN